jgi:hypothetical protein
VTLAVALNAFLSGHVGVHGHLVGTVALVMVSTSIAGNGHLTHFTVVTGVTHVLIDRIANIFVGNGARHRGGAHKTIVLSPGPGMGRVASSIDIRVRGTGRLCAGGLGVTWSWVVVAFVTYVSAGRNSRNTG